MGHSLITIMGLKYIPYNKDLATSRNPLETNLIRNSELLSNMYSLESQNNLQETVHPTKSSDCKETYQERRQENSNGYRQRSISRGSPSLCYRCLKEGHGY